MGLPYEKPEKEFGAPKPSRLEELNEQEREAYLRAVRRQRIARLVAHSSRSRKEQRRMIKDLTEAGDLPIGNTPCGKTLRKYERMWHRGKRTVEDYYDDPHTGRKKITLAPAIEKKIELEVKSGNGKNAHALYVELKEALGGAAPNYYQVHRRYAEIDRLRRSAARHGSRAARLEATSFSRMPSTESHAIWAIDELKMPVFSRQRDEDLDRWVSVRLDLVLIVDLVSTAVVGWYIADPSGRVDEDGDQMTEGVTASDVMAGLLSVACPELAHHSTMEFAGYLADRFRWDNAKSHVSVTEALKGKADAEEGEDEDDDHPTAEVDIRRIQKRMPSENGAVERRVDIVKEWCTGIRGHVDSYLPTDRITQGTTDLPRQRSTMAATPSDRPTRKMPITPEQLLTIEELRIEFDRVVRRYNYVHVNRTFGETARNRFMRYLDPSRPKNGRDLVRALEPVTTTVTTGGGIVHTGEAGEFSYLPIVDGAQLLVDTAVTYYADPADRGIFVVHGGKLHFVSRVKTSREIAKEIELNRRALARLASDESHAIREGQFIAELGEEGLRAAYEAYDEAVRELKARQRGEMVEVPEDDEPESGKGPDTATPNVEPADLEHGTPVDPWGTADTDDFIRFREPKNNASDDATDKEADHHG